MSNQGEEVEQGTDLENFIIQNRVNAIYQLNRNPEVVHINRAGQVMQRHVRLKSVRNRSYRYIRFVNCTNSVVGTIWVAFDGREWTYSAIVPQASYRQQTYQRHLWVVRSIDDGHRMCLTGNFPSSENPQNRHVQTQQIMMLGPNSLRRETIFISNPPQIQWKYQLHDYFPEEYKQYVRDILPSLYKVIRTKTAVNFDLVQHLVYKILQFLAPPLYYDISIHGQDPRISNDSNISPMTVPFGLQEMTLNN